MQIKIPENDGKYHWTFHVARKMRFYSISPSMVKRIIRHPDRTEKGIAPNTIAVMKKAETKKIQEIWVMYVLAGQGGLKKNNKIKIITAWRYPGKSPERDPVPQEIMDEVRSML